MRAWVPLAIAPLCYALPALALAGRMPALDGAQGVLLAAGLFAIAAVASLVIGGAARPARDPAALLGLGALAGAVFVPEPPALHAALVLASAIALGDAFADWIAPKLSDLSVIVTAAACLALFDVWSVTLGPAHNATSGGFLKRLLLDAPGPSGWMQFLGISDLVLIALLAGLARRRGAGSARAYVAGLIGVLACLAQAYLTRRPAPALPWIGAVFTVLAWRTVRPDAIGWRRTAKWSGITLAALALVTVVRLARG